jgi:hypothetical protein
MSWRKPATGLRTSVETSPYTEVVVGPG